MTEFSKFFLLKVETKVKTLEILSHEEELECYRNFTELLSVMRNYSLCLADFDPVKSMIFSMIFPLPSNYTNMAEMVFKNKSQDL